MISKEEMEKVEHGLRAGTFAVWAICALDPDSPTLKEDVKRLKQDIDSVTNGDPDGYGQQLQALRIEIKGRIKGGEDRGSY
jgi:hypothetical protein